MKKTFLLLVLLLIPFTLIGCQSNDNGFASSGELAKVSLSTSKDFGQLNTDFFAVYEEAETLETFQNIFTNAEKQEGSVDISAPQYDIEAIDANGDSQAYHLWIGEKDEKSTLMNVEDTHTIYSTSEEATEQLMEFVE